MQQLRIAGIVRVVSANHLRVICGKAQENDDADQTHAGVHARNKQGQKHHDDERHKAERQNRTDAGQICLGHIPVNRHDAEVQRGHRKNENQ